MENETTQTAELTAEQRSAVDTVVNEAISTMVDNRVNTAVTNLTQVREAEIGNDLKPRWMVDSVRFLNGIAKNANGNISAAAASGRAFVDSRIGLNDAGRAFEEREAVRIVRESGMNRSQAQRILSTLSDAAGQFLLPKPFLAEIFVTLEEYGAARRNFRGIPMANKTIDLKDVATKPAVNWENENAKIGLSTMTFGENQLVAKKMAALLNWTTEFEEDEVFGALSLASQLFGEALAEKEDSAAFMGAGGSDTANGGFTGVINLTGAEVYTMPATKTAFSQLTADDLSLAKRSVSLVRQRGAKWFMHQSIMGIVERLKDLEGAYIYRQPSAPGMPGTIWGDPVELVEVMPNIGDTATATRFIVYGNPENYLFGSRRGVRFDISREGTVIGTADATTAYSAFQQDGAILRVTQRLGFACPLEDKFAVIKTATS